MLDSTRPASKPPELPASWAEQLVGQHLETMEIIENVPDVIVIVRPTFEVLFANRWAGRLLGVASQDLIETPLIQWVDASDVEAVKVAIRRMRLEERGLEIQLKPLAGDPGMIRFTTVRPMDFEGGPAVLLIARDVTAERRLERVLEFSERLAALGTLSAGVAHEINNPLAFLSSNLDFIAQSIAEGKAPSTTDAQDLADAIADARDGVRRIGAIVRDLKTFSRVDQRGDTQVDLHAVIDWTMKVTRAQWQPKCLVEKDLRAVPRVMGSEPRLGQVVLNLLINAIDALPEQARDENRVKIRAFTDERGHAVVEVEDNGAGIRPQHLNQIFDPFFTTKPIGKGTGLGLSVSHGIVTAAGGQFTVQSVPGKGATFRVSLPPAST